MGCQSTTTTCNKRCRRSMTVLRSVTALCCLLLVTMPGVRAQEEDLCACSPSTYEFTFNFGAACPEPGGDDIPGVDERTCFVTSFDSEAEDVVPVSVQTISIIEADVDRVPIAQNAFDGDYEDGSTFTYSSVSALGNSSQIPQSIQLTITGLNEGGESLVLVWAIKFTNDCGIYPVLQIGETFGWTEFTDLGTPRGEVCSAAPQTPTSPVSAPTDTPESLPVTTEEPTAAPVEETDEPTAMEKKTEEPTDEETNAPTFTPTLAPVLAPVTESPTELSTAEVAPTKEDKNGKDDKETEPEETDAPEPTMEPTMKPTEEEIPVEETSIPSDEEIEYPSVDLSMSYLFTADDFEEEWGRSGKKQKKAKDKEDDRKPGKSRIGQRGRYHQ